MFRAPAQTKRRTSAIYSFEAPKGGWIRNQNIARPEPGIQGAWRLTNWFPTATGAELRGGSLKYATLGDGVSSGYVKSFLRYKNGPTERFFAAIDSGIYDISTVTDPDVSPSAVVTGTSQGRWSSVQFATTGGVFLVGVNGDDTARIYNGEVWIEAGADAIDQLNLTVISDAFEVGDTVTGGTSSATGKVVAHYTTGGTGYLLLEDVSGFFNESETVTGSISGSATVAEENFTVFGGVTGVDTADLNYVWSYKNRLFFIQKDSMDFYYADPDSIGGTLARYPLGGVFALGGSLMFGSSWSLDSSGDGGLSAQCVFVTTEGEVAVFQGADPSSASDWSLVGVYQIGKPLGANAWFRAGGDIIIATDIGLVPLSQAINRDVAALSPASVSYPIEQAWNEAVSDRSLDPWTCIIWPEKQMVVVALPTAAGEIPEMFVANARTGAWCNFLNWDGACLGLYQGRMFFGSSDGKVVEAYQTGADQGIPYTGVYVPLFTEADTPASIKIPRMANPVLLATQRPYPSATMMFDYQVDDLDPPSATPVSGDSVWGTAVWGSPTAIWGGGTTKNHYQGWQGVGGAGYAFAPALQLTSGSTAPLGAEIVRIDVTYETAGLI